MTCFVQDNHQVTNLQDEMATMRQSHSISMKRLQVLALMSFLFCCWLSLGLISLAYLSRFDADEHNL